jgi:hypothetical protein
MHCPIFGKIRKLEARGWIVVPTVVKNFAYEFFTGLDKYSLVESRVQTMSLFEFLRRKIYVELTPNRAFSVRYGAGIPKIRYTGIPREKRELLMRYVYPRAYLV